VRVDRKQRQASFTHTWVAGRSPHGLKKSEEKMRKADSALQPGEEE